MNTEQKKVLRKIIYAVETGGNVYGQQDYKDFTEAYTNSQLDSKTANAGSANLLKMPTQKSGIL